MQKQRFTRQIFTAVVFAGASSIADAAFVPDNSDLFFDITNLTRHNTFDISNISGVSGVGSNVTNWTLTDTTSWDQRTTTNDSWTYASLPGEATDRFHLGRDFTITFDKVIKSILFVFEDNEVTADGGFDFGITPTEISGGGISSESSLIKIGGVGGWALFTGLNTTTITEFNTLPDGKDISWFVLEATAVPIPASVWLFASGIFGLLGMVKRKKSLEDVV